MNDGFSKNQVCMRNNKYICTVDRLETAPEEKTYNKQEHKAGGKERTRDAGVNIHTICLPDEQK